MSIWIKVSEEWFEKLVESIPQRIKAGHKANARGIIAHHMGNLKFYEGTINAKLYICDFWVLNQNMLPSNNVKQTIFIAIQRCIDYSSKTVPKHTVCLHATEKYQPSKICTILLRKYKGESELNHKLELGF